jgi:hypothetical protein
MNFSPATEMLQFHLQKLHGLNMSRVETICDVMMTARRSIYIIVVFKVSSEFRQSCACIFATSKQL